MYSLRIAVTLFGASTTLKRSGLRLRIDEVLELGGRTEIFGVREQDVVSVVELHVEEHLRALVWVAVPVVYPRNITNWSVSRRAAL